MNVSRVWLEAFLKRSLNARDVAARLTMLGAPVDAIEALAPGLEDIVIGLVEDVVPHPNADRLKLATVNAGGGEKHQVVCGAPNVAAGKKYPFAPLGAMLPGAKAPLAKKKLRGIESEGMLCSARELGLGQDHDGILELDTQAAPGTPLLAAIPLSDDRLVLDVGPNRPDLLGHKGVARELAASMGTGFRLPDIPGSNDPPIPSPHKVEGPEARVGGATIRIEHPEGCRRFMAAVIRGVRVGPAPQWLARKIHAIGMRPINNVVDATNYVMFELNQPLHPYDLARLKGPALIARRAEPGEKLVTLDGIERTLTSDMTVIADASGSVGVAGVMGAAHVEVSESTTDVLLECAWFEPRGVRRTRRALGISSEASYRFERGVDLWNTPESIRRCIEIILVTAGGAVTEPPVDVFPTPSHPPRVFLRPARVARVLGVDLPWSAVEKALTAIGATVLSKPSDGRIAVDVPGWRPDLTTEIDLIEEIARIYGYDAIPTELRPFRVGALPDAPSELAERRIREGLAAWGLYEATTLPMGGEGLGRVKLLNPLSSEEGWLRDRLLPGLVSQAEVNWRAQTRSVRLFEIGTVFAPGGVGRPPIETRKLAGVITGPRNPTHWTEPKAPDFDLWDLEGLFGRALSLAVPGATMQVEGNAWVGRDADGEVVGRAERLQADNPPWAAPLFGFELEIDSAPRPTSKAKPLPTTPASERDLALILPAGVTSAEVLAAIRRSAGPALEEVRVVDEYRGEPLPPEARSVVFALVFRAPDRTLEKTEVDQATARVLKSLETERGIHLREA